MKKITYCVVDFAIPADFRVKMKESKKKKKKKMGKYPELVSSLL